MHPFRNLTVWQKAHELCLRVHRVSHRFDWREHSGLASQVRRAAYSVAYTIAEGCGRDTAAQFGHALQVARERAHELDYQLLLARDLGALDSAEHARLEARVDEVSRMLVALRRRVVRTSARRA
jgi:four helix bundle protein